MSDFLKPYIAHLREKDGAQQPLYVHSQAVSKITGDTAAKIGLEIVGRLAGLAHDLGKYSEAFQTYLDEIYQSYLTKLAIETFDPDSDGNEDEIGTNSQKKRIDHSSAGAQLIWQVLSVPSIPESDEEKMRQLAAQLLALVVVSHHGGLIDCIATDPQHAGEDRYTRRIEKNSKETHLDEIRSAMDDEIRQELKNLLQSKELIESVHALYRRIIQTETLHQANKAIVRCKLGLVARFLLSCLVEGDHRNSSEFENPETDKIHKGEKSNWLALSGLLENELKRFSEKTDTKKIDKLRAEISEHCLEAGARERGIYTLTVPTGGGKTLASLRFALKHAQVHKMDHIIYVIPFTSIIDQNAKAVRAILEPEGVEPESVILEHHSNLLPEQITWKHKLLSENWDTPIIYTTNIQLLEALFGGGTRNTRRMHTLARTVLIFDEIQALPLKCVNLFANAMNFLVEHAGSSVVMCTATQPLLHRVDSQKGAIRLASNPELMPDVDRFFSDLKRVEIIDYRKNGGWTFQETAELTVRIQDERCSVLVIVNTKHSAQEIFKYCKQLAGISVYHLSANMCPAHRREILDEIKKNLEGKEPLICVSTQLIEAGVDISFGSVIRSLAGMDSIAQAAGRANRHGEDSTAPVYIVNLTQEKIESLPDIVKGQDASERLFSDFSKGPEDFRNDLLSDRAMERYFNYYFFNRSACMDYPVDLTRMKFREKAPDETLLSILSSNNRALKEYEKNRQQVPGFPLHQAFRTAARIFKVIDSPVQSVIVPHGKSGYAIISELNGNVHPRKLNRLLRRAQQYSVNLFEHDFNALSNTHALYLTPSGIWCLDPRYYHSDFGISLEPRELTEEEKKLYFQ